MFLKKGILIMKVQEIKKLSSWDVMCMCIKENFYTAGTNDEYQNFLNCVDNFEVNPLNIYQLALDIYNHTPLDYWNPYGIGKKQALEHIMFLIGERVTVTYEIV